jgi:hypothetical protein
MVDRCFAPFPRKLKPPDRPHMDRYRFFVQAVDMMPSEGAFVAKVDDDTSVNLRELAPALAALRCHRHLFLGAIGWTAWVPRAERMGVRGLPCAQAAGLWDSLATFGSHRPYDRHEPRSCAEMGAVLPYPYGFGMGYIFSSPLLRWLANDREVRAWVDEAAGPSREVLQWQHYEDTTTGYWLAHAPEAAGIKVTYLSIARWAHDFGCTVNGEQERRQAQIVRPPGAHSILVHRLKSGGFETAWRAFSANASYEHARCTSDARAFRRLRSHRGR